MQIYPMTERNLGTNGLNCGAKPDLYCIRVGHGSGEGAVPPPRNFFDFFCPAMVHSGRLF